MSAELTFRNQVGEQIAVSLNVSGRASCRSVQPPQMWVEPATYSAACGRSGAAFSKLRFLGVIGAKLRAKVLPGGRAPHFHVAIAGAERLAAEHAAARATVHEIPAAREHRNLSTNLGYLNGAS